MKHSQLFAIIAALAGPILSVSAADPLSVTQGRASQKAGTRLVDVYYDFSGGVPPYTVFLKGSLDGGVTWTLPVTTVSGNVGTVTTAGTNRLVTWDAGTDWAGQFSANVKFRVSVIDSAVPPAPAGFEAIPAGIFTMGQPEFIEKVHSVYVSAFYMAKYETTKELWDEVRTWGLNNGYKDLAPGGAKAFNHPVYGVNWYDVVKWCNARSEKENLTPCYSVDGSVYRMESRNDVVCNWNANGYRLPTEAEWEKAARGGVGGKHFPWGSDTITHDQANYNSSTSYVYDISLTRGYHPSYTAGGTPYTAPVNRFTPNGYGLYNMSGNMWEWCWDWYGSYPSTLQTDPRGPASGSIRMRRGGSWFNPAPNSRVAHRDTGSSPGARDNDRGGRIARSSVP